MEILIVDEILSVGDIAFQAKSEKKMMEMIGKGMDANEALEKAKGQYGRVDDAVKFVNPRNE